MAVFVLVRWEPIVVVIPTLQLVLCALLHSRCGLLPGVLRGRDVVKVGK